MLLRKYPFKESTWGEQLLYAAIVFLILYLLRPFGLAAAKGNILLPCLASGLITFLLEMVHTLVARQVMKHKAKWTILDASVATILLVVFIGVGNFAFWGLYFGVSLFNLSLLLTFLYWTSIIGLFITFISIGISYNRMLRTELASMLNKTAEQEIELIRPFLLRSRFIKVPLKNNKHYENYHFKPRLHLLLYCKYEFLRFGSNHQGKTARHEATNQRLP